jgi:hypothetical protein
MFTSTEQRVRIFTMAKPGTCRRYIGNIGAKESGGSGRCGNSTITSEPPTVGAERTPRGPAALPIGRFRLTRLRSLLIRSPWARARSERSITYAAWIETERLTFPSRSGARIVHHACTLAGDPSQLCRSGCGTSKHRYRLILEQHPVSSSGVGDRRRCRQYGARRTGA